ncbi:MAG: hypothetical protein LC797_21965 [Chloroflexi bacterium]|nr:hypothetical protein [Chloroflexota bacterium]
MAGADMLEIARPELRGRTRVQSRTFRWGIVDVILAVLMLPFAIWMVAIEGIVRAVAALGTR